MAYPISDVTRRVVYTGSAGVGPYSFTFEVLANTDIQVYKNTTLLTLTTNYTVTINANGTGSVTLVVAATNADNITIVGDRAIQRATDFVTGGDLFANTLNDEFDSLVIFAQQVDEKADRGLKAPVTDPTDVNMVLPVKATRKGTVLAFDSTTGDPVAGPALDAVTTVIAQSANINTVATNIASVNTVAGNNTNVTTVAGVSGAVTTVAGISGNVTTVAGISANVTSVAGNSTNINAVNANSTNINTVAAANTAIGTVSTNIASVNTAATNIAAIIDAPNQATAAANSATAAAAAAASGMYSAVQDKSAAYTVVTGDAGDLIRVTTTAGAVTITLPLISGQVDGFKIAVVKWSSDANAVTVARSGSDTINGATSYSIATQYSSATFVADFETNQWFAVSGLSGATTGSGSIVLATSPTITTPVISSIVNTGTLTLPTSTDTLVGRATTDTLTNKTLTTPVISSISNTGTLTLPTSTDTLVGRATTDTLTNKTLTNPTVTNYVESVVAIGNSGTSQTLSLTNGTVQTVTMTGNCTFTMPTATAGKSFILIATQDGTGSRTAVFTSVKFAGGVAPTLTTTATTGVDILTFVANGTSWFGTYAQAFA